MAASLKNRLGVNEVTDVKSGLGKALIAEALGTLFINFFGCLSTQSLTADKPTVVSIALSFGFVVFAAVQTLGHVSGANLNPAVTVGLLVAGKVTLIRAFLYIIVQSLGAIAGSAVLKAIFPLGDLPVGVNGLQGSLTPFQGFGIEFILGFILVLVVFGVCDANRQHTQTIAALTIGLTVAVGHLATVNFTGTGMNPARSFGATVINNSGWEHHWIFWIGPILGGVVASLLYTYVLAAPAAGEYSPVNVEEKELKNIETTN